MNETFTDILTFAVIAIGIFTLYIGAVALLKRDPVRERLKRFVPAGAIDAGFIYDETKSPLAVLCESILVAFGTDLGKAKRELYFPMARAGLMSNDAVAYYLAARRVLQPVLFLLGLLALYGAMRHSGAVMLLYVLIGGMLVMFGIWGSKLYIANRTSRRKQALKRGFADVLDLLLVCVESGLPLDGALARVGREMEKTHPEMTAELDRTRVELSVLNDRVQALQNLAERTDAPGFRALVPALVQTERFGTSIAETLRVLSEEFRLSRAAEAETKAAKIPVYITFPLIAMILFPIFALIMAPPIIKINQQGGLFGNVPKGPQR